MTRASTGTLKTENGLSLFYRRWPGEAKRPVLLFVHGMNEHSGRYTNPVEYFRRLGYTIYAYDQRGHGKSGGPRAHADRFARLLGDLDHVLRFIRDKEGSKPLFIVGHSFGGQVVLNYAIRHPDGIAGIITSSANIKLAMPIPTLKKKLGLLASHFVPQLPVPSGLKAEHLSHDQKVVDDYLSDPLCGTLISVRLASEMLANQEMLPILSKDFRLPCLLMHAEDDKICDPEGTKEFYRNCASQDKTLKTYPGFYHELFNEVDKERVFKDIKDWLNKHV